VTEGKKRFSLVKPTLNTPFHIDFDWWQKYDRDWRVYLRSYLSQEDQQAYVGAEDEKVDIIDLDTAEVHRVDALQHILITKYANQEGFITQTTSISEGIFRLFLSNGNVPMTPIELSEKLTRAPEVILRMLSGPRVYKGIRPCPEC